MLQLVDLKFYFKILMIYVLTVMMIRHSSTRDRRTTNKGIVSTLI
jgi:hypothetical protein